MRNFFAVLTLSLLTSQAHAAGEFPCPPFEVKDMIERVAQCHKAEADKQAGEGDAEEIAEAMEDLNCAEVDQDKKDLLAEYKKSGNVKSMLQDYNRFVADYPDAKQEWEEELTVPCWKETNDVR